ncbi:hypothetical protein [Chryseobacterium sp. MYb328]|uniref:hypothetical protein n=1 Tax=Chryseobacterium sp. MYb328 TaxID=2745231 RepID=UPI003094E2BD
MEINNLWQDLVIKADTKVTLQKDLSEGKVPQLPYFVIGIPDVKEEISKKLEKIDDPKELRMTTSLIIAKYGNGKTNLLKYLELFFENHPNIKIIYNKANIDQPDLGLFLLKQIQNHFTETLINLIINMRKHYNFDLLTNNNPADFASIREYSDTLFEASKTEEEIKKLIYLGTGRLYTKNEFLNFGLEQLSNYERKEVLILFLNILALGKTFVIFQIDEIEKILEKSKLRLNTFLTSYRELYDMFSYIKGHYLQCCITDAGGDGAYLEGINQAFYSRIEPHILLLDIMEGKDDIYDLVSRLNVLFDINKEKKEIDKIVKELLKENHGQNRELVRSAVAHLTSKEQRLPLSELLVKYKLNDLYKSTSTELEYEGFFKSLKDKFFDPLEAYLEGNFMLERGHVKIRDLQSFIDDELEKIHYFILNQNISLEAIQSKIDDISTKYNYDIIIYSPEKLELRNGEINSTSNIEIVDYDPIELFVLLNMYRDNFEHQSELTKIIRDYTNNNL